MPYHFSTPFDRNRKADLPVGPNQKRFPWKRFLADSCYIGLKSASFAISTFLLTLGLPLFFFLLLAGWNMDLLFLQLDNIANRYVDADALRRLAFSSELKIGFFAIAGFVALWRIPRFVAELDRAFSEKAAK